MGGDVSGWIYDVIGETIRMTENNPSIRRGFGTIQRINDRIYVLGGDLNPGEKLHSLKISECILYASVFSCALLKRTNLC